MPSSVNPASFWTVNAPEIWPTAPSQMSVSGANEIEVCPRRWALSAANYPQVWAGRGYPPRLVISSLTGSVVHLVLKTVTKAMAHSNCTSLQDAGAVQVMRELGGYSKIIENCIEQVVKPFVANPRTTHVIDAALRSLRSRISEIRAEAQTFLGRINVPEAGMFGGPRRPENYSRNALGPGVYSEIELRAPAVHWHGYADLLIVGNDTCEIVDFKTGERGDAHPFQLLVYALLWNRDSELNPNGRLASKLTLLYRDGEVSVPSPNPEELDALEQELVLRRQAAIQVLSDHPPPARPSIENCHYCSVRQLCDQYWCTLKALTAATPDTEAAYMDLQISLLKPHGPSSWDGVVELSRTIQSEKPIVLRSFLGTDRQFAGGDKLRVLNARVSQSENEDEPVVGTLTTTSEVFFLPRES